MRVEVALALFMRVEVALALFMRVEVALGLFMRVVAALGLCMRVEVSRILVAGGRQSSTERAPTTTFLGRLGRFKQFPLARWNCLSRFLPLFPFIRREVLSATSSPPHLIVFSTILCLFSSLLLPVFLLSCIPHISLNTVLLFQHWPRSSPPALL